MFMEKIANLEIRNNLKEHNIKHWELADKLGISEYTLVRKLRFELPKEEKERVLNTIKTFKDVN